MRGLAALAMLTACGRFHFSEGDRDAAHTGFTLDLSTCPASEARLVGNANCQPGMLEITPDAQSRVGAAWYMTPFTITADTSFHFWVTLDVVRTIYPQGDGMAIVVQSDPRGTSAIGGTGGQIGYETIRPSFDIELDLFKNQNDVSNNEVNIVADGLPDSPLVLGTAPFAMADGTPFTVWLDYDGASHVSSVYMAQSNAKPASPLETWTDDLSRLGAAYFGVTASTEGSGESHRLLASSLDLF